MTCRSPTLHGLASCSALVDAPVGRLPPEAGQLLLQRGLGGACGAGRLRRAAAGLLVLLLIPALGRSELPIPAASRLMLSVVDERPYQTILQYCGKGAAGLPVPLLAPPFPQ